MEDSAIAKALPSAQDSSAEAPVEMAYVLFDQYIRGFCVHVDHKASFVPPLNEWLPISTVPPKSPMISTSARPDVCHRCHLVLKVLNSGIPIEESGVALSLDWNMVHPFDGTVQDIASNLPTKTISGMTHNRDYRCNCQLHPGTGRRSDAALLAGLLVTCAAQVQVVDCRVLFCSQEQDADMYTGSILYTLAFPYLLKSPTNQNNCKRSIVPRTTAKRISASSPIMPLNSAMRLLLTLARSDWGQLELLQELLMRPPENGSTRTELPFFPSMLTLGDIYNRIQGSASHTNRAVQAPPSSDEQSPLSSLPMDILQERLAPFWNARELASVRSTSMHFYWSLRSVVPGLKLRLYTHQVNSLFWMRQREASLIKTEADGFGTKENIHRDVTGGASVRLASNPATSRSELCVILDPWTGLEMFQEKALLEIEKLPRHVACGGLLCDDPGLGKTITVLALILQTCHPRSSPSKRRMPKSYYYESDNEDYCWDSDSCSSSESDQEMRDDKLFYTYWEEQVEVDFRRPALLKLINDFCKGIPDSGPFPLPQIQKDIAADVYGSDFSAFQSSVECVPLFLFHLILFQNSTNVFRFVQSRHR
jgi:SNF2-related domain